MAAYQQSAAPFRVAGAYCRHLSSAVSERASIEAPGTYMHVAHAHAFRQIVIRRGHGLVEPNSVAGEILRTLWPALLL